MRKRMAMMTAVMCLISCLCVPVCADTAEHAARQPDYTRTGSLIADVVTAAGEPVSGGTLTLYAVADAVENNGGHSFVYTAAFAECGEELDGINSDDNGMPALAAALSAWAESHGVVGVTEQVDEAGRALFSDLSLGLYLVVQETAATGYAAVRPFLVTVPMWDGTQLVYDVYANPKPGTVVGLAKLDPLVEKVVQVKGGTAPSDSRFTFRMTPAEADFPMPENEDAVRDNATGALTMTQQGPGSYEFGWMYFGAEHVGNTYTYTVEEVKGTEANYTYDAQAYTMTVAVDQDAVTQEFLLDVTYSNQTGETVKKIVFTNVYDGAANLPQTGQLWWPVPLLVLAGAVLCVYGWRRRSKEG